MSTLNLKNIQLGDNPDPSKNFVLSVPAVADGTLSIKRQDGTNVLSIDATGKAVIPGVVGTVAQVGGVPTGQIIERGSNANGEYVRYADGTQICTRQVNLGNVTIGANSVSTNLAILYGTFPAAFINGDISISYSQESGWSYAFVIADEGITRTNIVGWYLARMGDMFGPGDTVSHKIRYTAIGRWF